MGSAVSVMHEFHFLTQVQVPTFFQAILLKKADLDEFVAELATNLTDLERAWADLALRTVHRYSETMHPLLQQLIVPHLEFLMLLGTEGNSAAPNLNLR